MSQPNKKKTRVQTKDFRDWLYPLPDVLPVDKVFWDVLREDGIDLVLSNLVSHEAEFYQECHDERKE